MEKKSIKFEDKIHDCVLSVINIPGNSTQEEISELFSFYGIVPDRCTVRTHYSMDDGGELNKSGPFYKKATIFYDNEEVTIMAYHRYHGMKYHGHTLDVRLDDLTYVYI